jgi:DNA-binding MarR family transcriptional regulator
MKVQLSRRRSRHLDELAAALPQRASALTRIFFARTTTGLSRTEVGLLAALSTRPRRVTELAAMEGITQPAVTQLVNRLERRDWVERHADERDARAVLVVLTAAGQAALDGVRAEFRALLHEEMSALGDDEVETLAAAVDILDRLIDQIGGAREVV